MTTWARLQDGVVETNTDSCPNCGGKPEIIGAIVEQRVIEKILTHLGLRAHRLGRQPVASCCKLPDAARP